MPAASAAEQAPDPEALYYEAWYTEEGLRDFAKAVQLYREIATKYAGNKDLAARALTRAAGCYQKLGRDAEEKEIWDEAWKNYKEQIEKSPEYQHESVWVSSYIDKILAGSESNDLAWSFSKILEQMPPQHIIPERDRMLKQAEKLRDTDWGGAIWSLKLAIVLSMTIKDEATAARAQSDIGRIYLEQGVFLDAIQAYGDAAKEYSGQRAILAWNQMSVAEAHRLMSMTELARDRYNELVAGYPEQKDALMWAKIWIGDCYRDLEQLQTARETWKEAAENPAAKDCPRQAKLARILAGLEQPPAALDPAKKDEFTNDEAYFIAVFYEVTGDLPKAIQWMKTSLDLSTGRDWPYQLAKSWLSAKGGRD